MAYNYIAFCFVFYYIRDACASILRGKHRNFGEFYTSCKSGVPLTIHVVVFFVFNEWRESIFNHCRQRGFKCDMVHIEINHRFSEVNRLKIQNSETISSYTQRNLLYLVWYLF